MSANMPPIVKLEIQEMKYSILHYLEMHHRDIEANVEKQIEAVIESYPFEQRVRNVVADAITEAINHYFKYGNGMTAVVSAVNDMLDTKFGVK